MYTEQEIKAAVDVHAPESGIKVWTDVEHLPTYETDANGRLVKDEKGHQIARRDAAGEHIRHPKNRAHLALGRVTISIDVEHGESESPHEHTRRSAEEMAAIVREQTGNLLKEAARKPLTAAEHGAWTQEQTRLAAIRAAEDRAAHAADLRAQMSPDELAAADYLAAHGEPDFAMHGHHLHAYGEHLRSAVALGALAPEQADRERKRIAAWKLRCDRRAAAEVEHAHDAAALAAAHAKINEGV